MADEQKKAASTPAKPATKRGPRTLSTSNRVVLVFEQKYASTFEALSKAATQDDRELGPYIIQLLAGQAPTSIKPTEPIEV